MSNVSALPKIVSNAALLVPPLNVSALADALLRTTTDQNLRTELRKKGLARAQCFSYERIAVKTVRVLGDIVFN